MNNTNLKSYYLSSSEVEALLAANYGTRIQPVDYDKLNKVRREQQRLAALGIQTKKSSKTVSNGEV